MAYDPAAGQILSWFITIAVVAAVVIGALAGFVWLVF